MKKAQNCVLVIPDTQAPFHHPDSVDFLREVSKEYQTNTVVHIGDEMDFHALSDFSNDPDGLSAGNELATGVEFLKKLYKLFPIVTVCISNHTARPFRKAYKSGLPTAFLRSYGEFLEAPDTWEWADRWEIDDIIYEHGQKHGGQYAHLKHAMTNHRSTVIGHHHANAGVIYQANDEMTIWGMATGCLVDTEAYAFKYSKNFPRKPILGCGVVVRGHPLFIPMLTKDGRWTGKLGL